MAACTSITGEIFNERDAKTKDFVGKLSYIVLHLLNLLAKPNLKSCIVGQFWDGPLIYLIQD